MPKDSENVIPFRIAMLGPQDAELIETIMHFYSNGKDVPLSDMEVTTEPLAAIVERLQSEGASPQLDSSAFVFRVVQWEFQQQNSRRLVLVVIDQGRQRFFHYRSETVNSAPVQHL